MPEEHNRVPTDHCSNLLFCPTQTAVDNLTKEGITLGVHLVGDVMYDSVLFNIKLAEKRSQILETLNLEPKCYALATIHRPENTDDSKRLNSIFLGLDKIAQNGLSVVVPLRPRTKQQIKVFGLRNLQSKIENLQFVEPVSYLDMLLLEKQAHVIVTDSGGVQKEAYWFKVPCVTLRNETEWVETLESGWNVLVGSEPPRIIEAVDKAQPGSMLQDAYGIKTGISWSNYTTSTKANHQQSFLKPETP
jgi:UDP-N-acetylglucosamine 2-epimerase